MLGPMSSAPLRRGPPGLPSHTVGIDQALAGSAPLAQLARRMQASQDRLAAVLPLLPPAMRGAVRAGPIDEAGWSLLVSSNAVAAKLRQMVPALEARLRTQGFEVLPVRVKLLAAS
jgi:hypothetical protein